MLVDDWPLLQSDDCFGCRRPLEYCSARRLAIIQMRHFAQTMCRFSAVEQIRLIYQVGIQYIFNIKQRIKRHKLERHQDAADQMVEFVAARCILLADWAAGFSAHGGNTLTGLRQPRISTVTEGDSIPFYGSFNLHNGHLDTQGFFRCFLR